MVHHGHGNYGISSNNNTHLNGPVYYEQNTTSLQPTIKYDDMGNIIVEDGTNTIAMVFGIIGLIFLILFPCIGIPFLIIGIIQKNHKITFLDKERCVLLEIKGAFIDFGCLNSSESIPYDNIDDFTVSPDYSVRINGQAAARLVVREKSGVVHEIPGLQVISVTTAKAQYLKKILFDKLNPN
ncbi:hypothetical protein ABK040_014113 [Willaertia magna]